MTASSPSPHRMNRCALVHVARQVRDEPGNVGVAAAGHDLPRRLRMEREQPVVVEEADERERGKRSDRVERGRPDGRRHGKQIPVGEALAETAGLEKVAQRLAFRVRRREQRRRLPIEAHDLAEQREVRRPHQIPPLREEPVGAAAAVLEPAPLCTTRRRTCPSRGWPRRARRTAARDSDTCGRCAPGTRCRAERCRRAIDQHGVGVAAETPLLFEEVHAVPAAQQSGGRQTRKCPRRSRQCSSSAVRNTSTTAMCQAFVHDKSLTTMRRDTLDEH